MIPPKGGGMLVHCELVRLHQDRTLKSNSRQLVSKRPSIGGRSAENKRWMRPSSPVLSNTPIHLSFLQIPSFILFTVARTWLVSNDVRAMPRGSNTHTNKGAQKNLFSPFFFVEQRQNTKLPFFYFLSLFHFFFFPLPAFFSMNASHCTIVYLCSSGEDEDQQSLLESVFGKGRVVMDV